MHLGVFGGSFNPIHLGHLAIARQTRERLGFDRILFIPTGDPPHKHSRDLAPARDRFEMVRLALAGTPEFDVSDIELRRQGKSYTIDTVRDLARQGPPDLRLSFLIGLDAFKDLPSWREPEALLSLCSFVVLSRPGHTFQSLAALPFLPRNTHESLAALDTGTHTQLAIPLPSGHTVTCLALPPSPISASAIRERVRHGATLANLLPPPVESYILTHQLYREDPNRTHI